MATRKRPLEEYPEKQNTKTQTAAGNQEKPPEKVAADVGGKNEKADKKTAVSKLDRNLSMAERMGPWNEWIKKHVLYNWSSVDQILKQTYTKRGIRSRLVHPVGRPPFKSGQLVGFYSLLSGGISGVAQVLETTSAIRKRYSYRIKWIVRLSGFGRDPLEEVWEGQFLFPIEWTTEKPKASATDCDFIREQLTLASD